MSVDGMPLPAWKHARGRPGYPAGAEAWNRWYAETDYGWAPASSSVRSALNGLPPGRALDLGSGDGRHAVWLAGRGWHVRAMDFSTEALTIGRERAFAEGVTGLITWSVADVTAHNPAPGSLDLVLAAFLDLPGPDLQRVIARAAQALAPGGIFLFIGHDPADPREGTTGPRASMLHESTEVAVWARAAGLQVATAESRSRPVPGDRRPALDCVVLARSPARAAADIPSFNAPLPAKNTDRKVPS